MSDKQIFEEAEAHAACLAYFGGRSLSADIFLSKYAMRDKENHLVEKTPQDMHKRLALAFAQIDARYGDDLVTQEGTYFEAMDKFARIVPQGSPMAAVANPYRRMSASNCVVIASPEDSIEGIFDAGLNLAQLMKRRAGVGLDVSTLRPEGESVNNAALTTSGAWSFCDFFSYITGMVGQSGRRGALMLTIDVHHPDVMRFIRMKEDLLKVTDANVSVRLSDEFLQAVEDDTDYEVRWPLKGEPVVSRSLSAGVVWEQICKSAARSAEPGLIFWDQMTRELPANFYPGFESVSTNPCSEICLSPFDSCRLISINLTGYVRRAFTETAEFDRAAFRQDVALGMRMADNLVDIEIDLLDRIKEVCGSEKEAALWGKLQEAGRKGRRTGLGTHALGDTLAQLGIRYDSSQALLFADDLYGSFRDAAYSASIDLAVERGAFPSFDAELEEDCPFIARLPDELRARMQEHGRRNISLLTQAPTGSVAEVSKVGGFARWGTSSGVEPVFRYSYTRRKKMEASDPEEADFVDDLGKRWKEYPVSHPNYLNFQETYPERDYALPLPDYFVESPDIAWEKRVELQAVEQKYLDHSISSTINLPKGTGPDVVGGIYLAAWKLKLKGVTVYVDGSRDGVLITDTPIQGRPRSLPSETHKVKVDLGDEQPRNTYVTVSFFEGRPYEVFVVAPHQGLRDQDLQVLELTTRTTSLLLRTGASLSDVCDQLEKIAGQYIFSIPTNIARILRGYAEGPPDQPEGSEAGLGRCPGCKQMAYELAEGCGKCRECGHSGCG